MDILTHTLSGVAIGTVVASFSKQGFAQCILIVAMSGFGAAMPDIDAVSLWSRFDATIGHFFNLSHTGKEIYSAKLWYSHHAFMHSILAGSILTMLMGCCFYLISLTQSKQQKPQIISSLFKNKLPLIGFFLGFLIHLFEDMPTPASSWDGVNLFWPSSSYIGGTGDIWWWNNYDIFLIVVGVIMLNLALFSSKRWLHFNLKKWTMSVLLIGLTFAFIQIKTRDFDFAYSGHTTKYQEFENKSKQLQKEILGESVYSAMESIDNKLPIYF